MISKNDLKGFGVGTFGVGGMMERDASLDDQFQIDAIKYSINKGLNYLDISFLYAEGHANNIIKKALDDIDRNKLFINAKLGDVETLSDVEKQLDEYLSYFGFDYVDSFQIHSPSRIKSVGIEKVSEKIVKLTGKDKVRFLSISNCGPENIEKTQKATGNKVFSVENDYSFDVRPCEDVGILDYCKTNDILFIPYRPIRRKGVGTISNLDYPILTKLASKYNKTKTQILINWYMWKENVFPIIKSTNTKHIDENVESLGFSIDDSDYKLMDKFRIRNNKWDNVDWEYAGTGGTKISGLSFVFD